MTRISDLRCKHRHTIDEHPSCFARGDVKWPDVKNVDRLYERVTGKPWYTFPEYKIGYFDIEADGLKANFATLLSWCIKDKGGEVHSSVITKEELFDGTVDKRIVREFCEKMSEYKILVGYYSTRYDLPFMRSKALHHGLDFANYGDVYHWDLYYTVRNKLCLHRNSLALACDYLDINGKTPLKSSIWRKAKYGDEEALKLVLEHNIGDVEILEELHDKLEFSRKWIRTSV
jgi:uncharacterized protein YprB with RNaseH-like and TPR domain